MIRGRREYFADSAFAFIRLALPQCNEFTPFMYIVAAFNLGSSVLLLLWAESVLSRCGALSIIDNSSDFLTEFWKISVCIRSRYEKKAWS